MGLARAVGVDDLGAWLFKARGAEPSTWAHVRSGFVEVGTWCVRPSYRTDLVQAGHPVLLWVSGSRQDLPAGHPVLLWVSGSRQDLPAGIHAAGVATGGGAGSWSFGAIW